MMMSPALCPTLTLLLIVFSVFTISLSENLQVADAEIEFTVAGQPRVFEMAIGETEMQSVNITNLKANEDISFEVYAVGEGSEFFLFEEYITVGPKTTQELEVFVIIPEDHADNIEYHPQIKVLKRAPQFEEEVQMGIRVNIQQTIPVIIKIGDSPIFTAPEVEVKAEVPEEKPIVEKPKAQAPIPVEETLEEKMERIKAANQGQEVKVDDDFEEAFEEEAVPDYEPEVDGYIPEPVMDKEPDAIAAEEKAECDFIAWFLSLFGIGKC